MASDIVCYYTSVTGNMDIKKNQQRIEMVLDSKKIPFKKVDISASDKEKEKMRALAGNPTALPPQLCNGDQYCGDYAMFDEAVETESLEEFLKLK